MNNKNIGIIFHNSSYDQVYHGLSIALSTLALGWEVKCLFTYWSLNYLKKDNKEQSKIETGTESHRHIIEDKIKKGHIQEISDVIAQAKPMGLRIYVCTNSMGLLNIARNELVDEVDKATGLTTFLAETEGYRLLFI